MDEALQRFVGISKGGRRAEILFREYTGASGPTTAAEGDAILDGHPIEIKFASASTLNQVRAVKYSPLVVLHSPPDEWYVVPAHEVVLRVAQRRRGQHTENPFESATLNLRDLGEFRVSDPVDLRSLTLGAIAASALFPELIADMRWILQSSRELADESTMRVGSTIERNGLTRHISSRRQR